MIENLIYAIPDIALLFGAIGLLVMKLFKVDNPRKYFFLSKLFLLLGLVLSLVFYNKIFAPGYLIENSYTTMVKIVVYISSLSWFYISYKWFVGKDFSGFSYCFIGLLLTEELCLLISCVNIFVLCCLIILFSILIGAFMHLYIRAEYHDVKKINDTVAGLLMAAFMIFGAFYIFQIVGSGEYGKIRDFLLQNKVDVLFYLSLAFMLLPLFALLSMFPLCFLSLDTAQKTILPVNGYIAIVVPIAGFSSLLNFLHGAIYPVYEAFKPAIVIISILSIYYGAMAARKEENIRKLFAYGSMYHFGVVLLIMSYMSSYAVLSSFVYFIIYILALFGIYTAMFAFKSRGEYLTNLSGVAGLYQVMPYVGASLLILLLSMLGTPPLLGFLGQFYITNQLFMADSYLLLIIIMLPLGALISAYLRLIKSIYFENRQNNFDRVDKGIYFVLLVTMVLILISLFRTYEVVKLAKDVIYNIF